MSFNNSQINYNEALLIESYFKTKSTKNFYLNVMNNKKINIEKYEDMYVRKEHGYAHIAVLYYSNPNESNFRDFEDRQYYYITRLQNGNILNLRKDLVERWNEYGLSNVSVLVLDEKHNKIAEIPTKILYGLKHTLSQSQNLDFLMSFNLEEDNLIWKHVTLCATENEVKTLLAEWQYLGNVAYAKYRESVGVKIISYNANTGAKRNTIECKSIKQAFSLLENKGINISYKTFQRRCKTEKPSLLKADKFLFYVTDKIDFNGEDVLPSGTF